MTRLQLLHRRGERLDQPRASRRAQIRPSYEPDAFGRAAERIARFLGTARFIAVQTVVVMMWLLYNIFAPASIRFDNYPFIFLTLALSLQAAYAAPLILLAQNRQDDRDRANLTQDREASIRLQDDSGYLARELAAMRISIGDLASRDFLRSELKALLVDLDGGMGGRGGKGRKNKRDRRRDDVVPAPLNGVSGPARPPELAWATGPRALEPGPGRAPMSAQHPDPAESAQRAEPVRPDGSVQPVEQGGSGGPGGAVEPGRAGRSSGSGRTAGGN